MNSHERVLAACEGAPVDYVPASFWGHDYRAEQTPEGLADATVRFQRTYGWDLVKINPRAQYHVEDWGVRYRYPEPEGSKCERTDYPIHGPDDYARIRRLDPRKAPVLAGHLQVVERVARELPEVPVVMTVFNPLSVLKYAADSEQAVVGHLRSHPAQVRAALDAVRDTFRDFAAEAVRRGAAGIFYATTAFATHDRWTPEEYMQWSREDDLAVLGAVAGAPFNVLHVCRARNFVERFRDYPVAAWSWATTEPGNPPLGFTPWLGGAAVGGISQETALQQAGPEAALAEYAAALQATRGRRFLLGPGCSIPPETPAGNLRALREVSRQRPPV
ncbi:MAG TPA: uroporphyrinogen decarboxylase family protein [Candidatus Saccharimonadales bacterium]|nr:uroporphyrinogen decarboxylase family protein [Candidatus Saccharimonadales bacterium]